MGLEENKNVIGKYLDDIKIELGLDKDEVSEQLNNHLLGLGKRLMDALPSEREMACKEVRNLINPENISISIYLYSFLKQHIKQPDIYKPILSYGIL